MPQSKALIVTVLLFSVGILMPIAAQAQAVGRLTGAVTDTSRTALPGVKVIVTSAGVSRAAITDIHGRYEFLDLPSGAYTATADLAGFERPVEKTAVTAGRVTSLSFVLKPGCISIPDYVDLGFSKALRQADAVAQIRISESKPPDRCPIAGVCVCSEQVAVASWILKAPRERVSAPSMSFLQEGDEKPYAPGQEYIAFLRWDSTARRFVRYAGRMYIFPIRDGRVEFLRTDAPGIVDGMSIEDFRKALRAIAN